MSRLWNAPNPAAFDIGTSGQRLIMLPRVLRTFARYQQFRPQSVEAGGQLFAQINGDDIIVQTATKPHRKDICTRYSYIPDRTAQQTEIDRLHARDLHFVGDWHTHPDSRPLPSPQDMRSIKEAFRLSKHFLNGFLLVIVGTEALPGDLYVGLHSITESLRLQSHLTPTENRFARGLWGAK
jgi:integrative and conjugative element protein (TIGR02256 family)